jgi:23S rRNA (uracil1939-C5)-methyltransferase
MASTGPIVPKTSLAVGDTLTLEIDSLNSQAEGIGRAAGYAVFVPGALPGDTVEAVVNKVAKSFARGTALRLEQASANRETARCPIHIAPEGSSTFHSESACGGCLLQTYNRQAELEFKRSHVQETLGRIGKLEAEVLPVVAGAPYGYRNKMSFALTQNEGRLAWGLRGIETGEVALPSCDISQPALWDSATRILAALNNDFGPDLIWNGESGYIRGVTVRVHTGIQDKNPMLSRRASTDPCAVALFAVADFDLEKAERVAASLADLPEVRPFFSYSDPRSQGVYYDRGRFLNRLPGKPPKWGDSNFREEICAWHTTGPWSTLVGPTTFLQVNDEIAERLYRQVLGLPFEGNGFAVDAYCGVGILTRALAERYENVMGIELDTQSIKLARTTARRLEDCRVEWVAEPSESVFATWGRESLTANRERPDLVILDPPRKGCQNEVLDTLTELEPKDVVYISCHPAALARDLRILCKKAFKPVRIEPFDMFPQTHHVETLVHLKS